jgi:hypothetical protein
MWNGASTYARPEASAWRTPMNINTDWFYIVLTIVVFAVLWLIVKGVEHFER